MDNCLIRDPLPKIRTALTVKKERGIKILRRHSATFKAKVALEVLKGERKVSQLSASHEVHPGQVFRHGRSPDWKEQPACLT